MSAVFTPGTFADQVRAAFQPSRAAIEAFARSRYGSWYDRASQAHRDLVDERTLCNLEAAYATEAVRIATAIHEGSDRATRKGAALRALLSGVGGSR